MKDNTLLVSVEVEKNEDGYIARIPGIQGAFAEGDSIEEAVFNCIDVVKMIFEYRKERKEKLGFNEIKFTRNAKLAFTMPVGI